MLKIILFTDALASGGAQRQLVGLAKLLSERGFKVKVVTYFDMPFYASFLKKCHVPFDCISGASNKTKRFLLVYKYLMSERPDIVISYLDVPNILVVLSRIFGLKSKLIVSERNTTQYLTIREKLKFLCYRFVDVVVCNSHTQHDFICVNYPRLKHKLITITNFVDLKYFRPSSQFYLENDVVKILVIARYEEQKNAVGFLEVISIVRSLGYLVHVDWYGNNFSKDLEFTEKSQYYLKLAEKIREYGADSFFVLHNQTQDVLAKYHNCDIFALPSFYEGYPNVICEAMACGKPILASNVCDNDKLVETGVNGYLFDPQSLNDMVEVTINMLNNRLKFSDFSKRSRMLAKNLLDEEIFVSKYIKVINEITQDDGAGISSLL